MPKHLRCALDYWVCDTACVQSDIWQTKNTMSLAELWVGLLKFYCVDFDRDEYVIGVRHSKWLTRSSKQWASKKIAIEGMLCGVYWLGL
jgi:hypothetical protein